MLLDLFQVNKPALAMVQLRPLPGSYRYRGEPLPAIIAAALDEVAVLAGAGFDGVQLQNMGDNPSTRHVGPETVAYMTAAATAIRQRFPHLSLSILVNWDAEAAIAVADATAADFVRIEHTFTGVSITAWGLSEACCYEATRFHRRRQRRRGAGGRRRRRSRDLDQRRRHEQPHRSAALAALHC